MKYVIDVVDGSEHLYNTELDPLERIDTADRLPAELERLRGRWQEFAAPLTRNGYHVEIRGARDRAVRWTLEVRADPVAQLVNTDRVGLEPGELLTTADRNLAIAATGVVEAGATDGVRFDLLTESGTLHVEVRFDDDPRPAPVHTVGGRVEGGIDIESTQLGGRRDEVALAGRPSEPGVLLWRMGAVRRQNRGELNEDDRQRLRALGYLE